MAFEHLSQPLRAGRILHDDAGILVVDKPSGVPVHGGDEVLAGDLVSRLSALRRARGQSEYLGVHQRLDEETSGVLLFTTTRERNAAVARALAERELERRYVAAVELANPAFARRLERGSVQLEHRLSTERGASRVVRQGGVPAVAEVELRSRQGSRALLALSPSTGRTHQLRVQLAHEGAPVAGDARYGGASAPRLLLHAAALGFEGRHFRAAVPELFGAWVEDEPFALGDEAALALAVEDACLLRAPLTARTDVYRLANELGDGLPGVTIDRYGDFAVLAVSNEEAAARAPELARSLLELGARGVYLKVRVKGDARHAASAETAPEEPFAGEPAPESFFVSEYGMELKVELARGMSTGLFVDQRDNRRRLRERAHGARVLNLFAYTSSFGVAAALGGAKTVTSVDISRRPLELARENFARNGIDVALHRFERADALAWLGRARRDGARFDQIVLDPPSFATSAGGAAFNVAKGYGKLAELALEVLAPGGTLLAVTNHRATSLGRFRRTLRDAAAATQTEVIQLKDVASQLDCPEAGAGPVPSKSVLLTRR